MCVCVCVCVCVFKHLLKTDIVTMLGILAKLNFPIMRGI